MRSTSERLRYGFSRSSDSTASTSSPGTLAAIPTMAQSLRMRSQLTMYQTQEEEPLLEKLRRFLKVLNMSISNDRGCMDLSHSTLRGHADSLIQFLFKPSQIIHLDLSANSMRWIKSGNLLKLVNLKSINISKNKIECIYNIQDIAIMAAIGKLQKLDLSINRLTEMNAHFGVMTNLTSLNVNENYVAKIEVRGIQNCIKLNQLSLSKNELSSFPKLKLLHLLFLDLSRNLITDLHDDTFKYLPNLQFLDLSHNSLKTIPSSICDCSQLLSLSIQWNYIRDTVRLLTVLKCLPQIQVLAMHHNELDIAMLKTTLLNMEGLRTLQIHDNSIDIPEGVQYQKPRKILKWINRNVQTLAVGDSIPSSELIEQCRDIGTLSTLYSEQNSILSGSATVEIDMNPDVLQAYEIDKQTLADIESDISRKRKPSAFPNKITSDNRFSEIKLQIGDTVYSEDDTENSKKLGATDVDTVSTLTLDSSSLLATIEDILSVGSNDS